MRVDGWDLYVHPLFEDQISRLTASVEARKSRHPESWTGSTDARLLNAIRKLVRVRIPADPAASMFRQGATLGPHRKHWFRARFGNGRYRLFFRYDSTARIIVFAWINDDNSLRTYGSKTDAYAVFRGMLDGGDPPDDWPALVRASRPMGEDTP